MRLLVKACLIFAAMLASGCAMISQGPVSESDANAAKLNLQLGVGYMQQGNYQVALEKLKKSLEYNDRFAETHNALGVLYEETGENALAEEHYQRAVALDDHYTLAKMNYGRFLCAHGKPAEGESLFLAVASDPSDKSSGAAYTSAGSCAKQANDLGKAEEYFRKALEQNPNDVVGLYEMTQLSHQQAKDLQARAFLQRYHDLAGYSPASLLLGIEIEDALGGGSLRQEYERLLLTRFGDSDPARRIKNR